MASNGHRLIAYLFGQPAIYSHLHQLTLPCCQKGSDGSKKHSAALMLVK